MAENRTKARLAAGGVALGCFTKIPHPALAEVAALSGWDFVVCDAEHGPASAADVEAFARACEVRGATPAVRVASGDAALLARALDAGAQGVHVPWVESAADAERAVAEVRFPPAGRRGLAGSRAAAYGLEGSLGDYAAAAAQETLVVAQVESPSAVDAAEAIAAVDGVDVVFVGPVDLSAALGHPGEVDHPEVRAAAEHVAGACARAGAVFGIHAATPAAARSWIERGARYVTASLEPLLARAMRAYLDETRSREDAGTG